MAHLWSSCFLISTPPSHRRTTSMIPAVQRRLRSKPGCFYLFPSYRFKVEKYLMYAKLNNRKKLLKPGRKCTVEH